MDTKRYQLTVPDLMHHQLQAAALEDGVDAGELVSKALRLFLTSRTHVRQGQALGLVAEADADQLIHRFSGI